MSNRVVVTGMGIICSIGNNLEEFETGLREGRSGLKPIEASRFDASDAYFRIHEGCTVDPELYAEINEVGYGDGRSPTGGTLCRHFGWR
jgi:3-oxoacyl-(acyl-carrier-protein) synthase